MAHQGQTGHGDKCHQRQQQRVFNQPLAGARERPDHTWPDGPPLEGVRDCGSADLLSSACRERGVAWPGTRGRAATFVSRAAGLASAALEAVSHPRTKLPQRSAGFRDDLVPP